MKQKKLSVFLLQLNDRINFVQTWILKKEVSIWAATVLYFAISGYFLTLFLEQNESIIQDKKVLIIIAITVMTYIFLVFICTQFSVWIYSSVLIKTLRRGLNILTFDFKELKPNDFENDEDIDLPKFLKPIYEEQQKRENQFHEKWRPFKILWYTLCGAFAFFLKKSWRKKLSKNREKQEGLIYLLIIIIWIFNIYTFITI